MHFENVNCLSVALQIDDVARIETDSESIFNGYHQLQMCDRIPLAHFIELRGTHIKVPGKSERVPESGFKPLVADRAMDRHFHLVLGLVP